MSSNAPIVIGGKLKFKSNSSGNKLKKKSNNNDPKISSIQNMDASTTLINTDDIETLKATGENADDGLTDAQRRHREKKRKLEEKEAKKLINSSFRTRIDEYNNRLASLTEHNDIPRVSAAGNG
eukprot:gene9932-13361_t